MTVTIRKPGTWTAPATAGVALGIGLGIAFSAVFLYFAATSRLVDLNVYRMGGDAVLAGGDPYAEPDSGSGLPFTYTPFAAAAFAPIALLPGQLAQVLWTFATLVCLGVFCALCALCAFRARCAASVASTGGSTCGFSARAAAVTPRRRLRIVACCSLTGFALLLEPVRSTVSFGQINIVLALMVAHDLFGRCRFVPRGVLTGIAAGIKLTPLIFLPYLLLTGRWRDAAAAAASFGATVAVGFAVSPRPSATYWTHTFFDAGHIGGIPYTGNQSLFGVLSRLMGGAEGARPLYLPLAGVLLAAGLAAAVLLARRGRPLLGGATCALTGLLTSPISWSHHWVWLVPLLLGLSVGPQRPPWGRAAAGAGYVLAALAPIWWVPHGGNLELAHSAGQIALANSYFAAAAALLAGLLWHAAITSHPRRAGHKTSSTQSADGAGADGPATAVSALLPHPRAAGSDPASPAGVRRR